MKSRNQKGVTLVTLVTAVIVALILAGIATTAGKSTLEYAKFNKLKNELTTLQTKVNELNQEGKTNIGQKIGNAQKEILNTDIVSNIIYKNRTDEEKSSIENGFRFLSSTEIENQLGLEDFNRNYLINVEYRYVVAAEGLEYEGTTYYMIDQIEDGMYNVEYHNKNSDTGSFDVSTKVEGNICKIVVSNIQHEGYVSNWQVKYKLDSDETWRTSNSLEFEVDKEGNYIVNVVHGDEIDLGKKHITISSELGWDQEKDVNKPKLMPGMKPIKFEEPTDSTEGKKIDTTITDPNWYDYENKQWANAETEDGSMWVWIPRYAYKINSSTQTCDIVFLIGTTDNYYDKDGNIQTAQRQITADEIIETDSTKTDKYTVHPAFTNESDINYANGGWDEELRGIWVAKFEAGYVNKEDDYEKNNLLKSSSVTYEQSSVWTWSGEAGTTDDSSQPARNWLDGVYGSTKTAIKYPTFQGLRYSMNYINNSNAFGISRALTESGNIYGLSSSSTDSHLMKNSEWGAVSYLSQSKYGLDGTNIVINNACLYNTTQSAYAVTGCAGEAANSGGISTTIDKIKDGTQSGIYTWTQKKGTVASSTGTIYGIYDLSGGVWERTAAIVNNGNGNLNYYGKATMAALNNGGSSKYVTVYPHDTDKDNTSITSNDANLTEANKANYLKNTQIYGDAVRETSTAGVGQTSWYNDYSCFPGLYSPFFARGGRWWLDSGAGLFSFFRNDGSSLYNCGFRSVLVAL